jgi:endothelin-converting enzyme/putative endopeptidase
MKPSVPAVSDTRLPGDGFYTFVNETWLKGNKVPGWKGEYGVSDEMTNNTDKELLQILHSLPHLNTISLRPKTATQHLQLLGYIWKNKAIEKEEQYLQVCLHSLMSYKDTSDIGRFLGWLVRCSIPTILDIGAREELQAPYLVRANLSTGQLLLPLKYYLEPHLKKTDVWIAYEEFVSICSVELGLPFLHKAIEAEQELAPILNESFRHLAQNKKGSSLKSWFPEFEWSAFMEGIDITWEKRIWTINSSERFKDVLKWICSPNTSEEKVISILSIHLVRVAAPYLRPSIRNAYSKLYRVTLRGVSEEPPYERRMLSDIQEILPDALCNLYAKKHKDQRVLSDIKKLVLELKEAAVNIMSNTEVFSKRTKSRVKEKLHRMWFELGKGHQAPLPDVIYTPDSLLHTIFSIHSARTKVIPSLTGKPADKIHSTYPCFITNASYFEESNHIVIPWGILQWPFYHLNAPLGWNYGGIGATICHEMTHGFDLEGSLYSPRGAYKEWWTRKNRQTFKKQTRKVSRFFSKFKHYGKKLDGEKTLSENWADLGGLKIALHGLNKILEDKPEEERKEAHRNFFIAYAVSWREITRKKSMLYSILTSVHAPAEDRVDRIVPQFKEWVQAFNVKETDALFIPEGKRLHFF